MFQSLSKILKQWKKPQKIDLEVLQKKWQECAKSYLPDEILKDTVCEKVVHSKLIVRVKKRENLYYLHSKKEKLLKSFKKEFLIQEIIFKL